MASISAYDSNSMGMLLSSLNTSKSKAGSNMLGINLQDYATIQSGSYFKLMKAYYGNDEIAKSHAQKVTGTTSTSEDTAKVLANVEEEASDLTTSANALYKNDGDNVFKEVTKTDDEGNTTRGYDVDAIYKKVSAFVSDYNSLIQSTEESESDSIARGVDSLESATEFRESELKKIGISYNNEKGTLSIDADTFKSSDMEDVKKLFKGNSSYAYEVAVKSSMIESSAKMESSKSNTYTGTGQYSNNYNSGTIFSDYF